MDLALSSSFHVGQQYRQVAPHDAGFEPPN
jgi:hypothetical protein